MGFGWDPWGILWFMDLGEGGDALFCREGSVLLQGGVSVCLGSLDVGVIS